jgi:Putative zinc-finger
MPEGRRCEELREPLVELALGIASGEERARVLEHVARCPGCRRLLGELSQVSDELLSLAPEHEPPAGFELRVLDRLGTPARPQPGRRRRWSGRRALVLAASGAALAAGVAAAAGVLVATDDERRLGAQLQAVLSRADGQYIAVTELREPSGGRRGLVFHYGGDPSWIYMSLDRPLPPGRYEVALLMRTGAESRLSEFELGPAQLGLGATVRIDPREASGVLLSGPDGARYTAHF